MRLVVFGPRLRIPTKNTAVATAVATIARPTVFSQPKVVDGNSTSMNGEPTVASTAKQAKAPIMTTVTPVNRSVLGSTRALPRV